MFLFPFNLSFNTERRAIEKPGSGTASNVIKYSQIHINDAFEFADLIFTNNLDKVYFLRQYFKDMHVSMEPLTLSENFCRQ